MNEWPWWAPIAILCGIGVGAFILYCAYVFIDERWNGDRS